MGSRSSEALLPESPAPSSPSHSLPSSPTPSSISSILSSTSSSGSTWEELRQARRAVRAKKRVPKPAPSQEKRVRLPKLAHPVLLQRRDTRTQLYSEMLKHQYVRKEKQAATQAEAEKGEGAGLPLKPVQLAPAPPPTVTPKGSFIDPKQQYSSDKTKWRSDLYKLLMLRISPAVEGRTAAEDFLASAQMALGGRALSWELFSSLSQSLLLAPPDKASQEPAAWKKYLDKLLRAPGREGLSQEQFSQARLGTRERPPSSKSVAEGPKGSMEDLAWELAESDEEGAPGKKKKKASRARREEGQLSGRERKKILKRREKLAREAKVAKEKEQEVPVAQESEFLPDGREWEEGMGKALGELVGKEREVPRGREREMPRGREREVPRGREREVLWGREQEVAKEVEVAKEREEEVTRAKELEMVGRKSRVRRRPWKEEPVRRSLAPREMARRKEEPVEEKAAKVRSEVDDWALAWERALKQAAEGVLAQVMHRSLIQVRKMRLAEAREKALSQVRDQAKVEAGEMALERARQIALAVLKDKLLEDVRALALAEAQKVALAEAREKLLAETRQAVLAEVRVRALAEAQAQVLAEGLEGVRAVARIRELAEARAMELAEARALKIVQGMKIVVDEERVLALASEGLEQAEERAMQLAEAKVMEMSEESIWELVKPKIEQMVKMRAQELAEEKLTELHSEEQQLWKESREEHLRRASLEAQLQKEDLALRLRRELLEAQLGKEGLQAQLKMEGVAGQLRKEGLELQVRKEALERELGKEALDAQLRAAGLEAPLSPEAQAEKEARGARLREEALAVQLRMQALEVQLSLEAQLRKDALEAQLRREAAGERPEEQAERERLEEEQRSSLSSEDEEGEAAALWEDIGEEAWAFTEEEREALLAVLEEQALGSQVDFQARAQLLLDILSGPEKLDASDASFQQRLFQVVSLLEISSSMEAEDLAEALLQKAQDLLLEAEARQQEVSEKAASVLLGLRRAVEAHRPRDTDPRAFASRMRALLKMALAVLRAKSLKERLRTEIRERTLWEKTEKEWKRGEERVLGKRLKQSLARWQAEQDRAEQKAQELQRRERRRLKFRTQPILLGVGGREGRRVAVEGAQEGGELGEEEVRRRALLRARQRQTILMWSLTPQRQLALKATIPQRQRVWKPMAPRAGEAVPSQASGMPRAYRIPKNSLYLLGKPLRRLRPGQRLWSGTRRPRAFRAESKAVDWEAFMKLYQGLLELKAAEGGVGSAEWQERSSQLLDRYGVSHPLVRALLQRLLLGDYRQHKYVASSLVRMGEAEASLGQRILYELVHHSARLPPKAPSWQGVIPLSYQNNVHTLQPQGTSRCGTTALKWQTCFLRRPSKLRLLAVARTGSKRLFAL